MRCEQTVLVPEAAEPRPRECVSQGERNLDRLMFSLHGGDCAAACREDPMSDVPIGKELLAALSDDDGGWGMG